MAEFAIRNLSALGFAQGFTLWQYRHDGPVHEALAEGFFRPAHERFEAGDMILLSAQGGGAVLFVHRNFAHRTDADEGVLLEAMATTIGARR